MKILFVIVLLLGWGSDFDYIRGMRWTSVPDQQRWRNYRIDRGILDNEIASRSACPAMRALTEAA